MLEIIKTALEDILMNAVDVGENVGETEEEILNLLDNNPRLSAVKIADKLKLSSRQVERIIRSLREEGRLVRHGANRGGFWEVRK